MKDQELAGGTVCDWSKTAMDGASAFGLIDRALREFQVGRPRSKHIQIPIEVLGMACESAPEAVEIATPNAMPDDAVLRGILQAKRVVFVFGGGARYAADAAREVVEKLGAAAFMTYAGRGIIAPEYPLNFGSYLARPDSADVIASADLVIAVGTELSETDLWRDDLGQSGQMIRVDIDPAEMSEPGTLNVLCDAGVFLRGLADICVYHQTVSGWASTEVRAARARWRAASDAERPGIVPIAEALREALPRDTMIFSDMTQFAYVAKEVWDMPEPGLWHHPCGFGTLGYALPAAIGGKAGVGDQPVVAIAGDYGFQYTLQELGTAAELGQPLPILLWDNEMLKEIEASMASAQIAPVAVKALNPSFDKLAEAYGIGYVKPGDLEALKTAVLAALRAEGPVLIHMTPAMVG